MRPGKIASTAEEVEAVVESTADEAGAMVTSTAGEAEQNRPTLILNL